MLRFTALFVALLMLLGSSRLLTCGLECLDEMAAPAEASCHEDSPTGPSGLPTAALAKVGDGMHACLPETAPPTATVAKPGAAQWLMAAPLVTVLLAPERSAESLDHRFSPQLRFESPHPSAPPILRI